MQMRMARNGIQVVAFSDCTSSQAFWRGDLERTWIGSEEGPCEHGGAGKYQACISLTWDGTSSSVWEHHFQNLVSSVAWKLGILSLCLG